MIFLITGTDGAGTAELRIRLRPDHVAYWTGLGDRMKLGGPLLAAAAEDAAARASVLLVDARDEAEAWDIARGDPFAIHHVFASLDVSPMRLTLGSLLPA